LVHTLRWTGCWSRACIQNVHGSKESCFFKSSTSSAANKTYSDYGLGSYTNILWMETCPCCPCKQFDTHVTSLSIKSAICACSSTLHAYTLKERWFLDELRYLARVCTRCVLTLLIRCTTVKVCIAHAPCVD